jgi:hypothetical protein
MRSYVVLSTALLTALGCGSDGSSGGLGQIQFSADCGSDEACLAAGLDAPLAVGASLKATMIFSYRGSAATMFTLTSVNPSVVMVKDTELIGVADGTVALLVSAPDGRLVDFIHLSAATADRLDLHRLTMEGAAMGQLEERLQLLVGESAVIDVRHSLDGTTLLGSIRPEWTTNSQAITLLDDGLGSRRRIVARTPGVARLTVAAVGLTAQLDVEVLP